MSGITIVRDTREKKPYEFSEYPISVKDKRLETGDYTIEGYEDEFAIERKTKSDFLRSITQERDRFQEEVKRASDFSQPMLVVIESPEIDFRRGNYYSNVHPNSVMGTIESWENYNVSFVFERGRSHAEELTYQRLCDWYISET